MPKIFTSSKKKDKTSFYSSADEWILPAAPTIKPKEREFVADSKASMHVVSRKDLVSAKLETVRISKNPTTVVNCQWRGANKRRGNSARCTACPHSVYSDITHRVLLKTLVHLCLMKKTSSLRAMSYTVQHATPTTDTSSSPSPVPRSLSHCANLRPLLERDCSPELPPLTGYEPNRIVANRIVDD